MPGKQRLGWHIAQALAERGYRLAIHYRSSKNEAEQTVRELESRGITARAYGADLRDENAVRDEMAQNVLHDFSQIDVLVNAAAIWQHKKSRRSPPRMCANTLIPTRSVHF